MFSVGHREEREGGRDVGREGGGERKSEGERGRDRDSESV
jgi:hypothetical protein